MYHAKMRKILQPDRNMMKADPSRLRHSEESLRQRDNDERNTLRHCGRDLGTTWIAIFYSRGL